MPPARTIGLRSTRSAWPKRRETASARSLPLPASRWTQLDGRGTADLTLTGNQLHNRIWDGANDDILDDGNGADRFRYRLGDGDDIFTDFGGAGGDRVALFNITVSQLVNNIATMSDGSILTTQTGYAWAASDFVLV